MRSRPPDKIRPPRTASYCAAALPLLALAVLLTGCGPQKTEPRGPAVRRPLPETMAVLAARADAAIPMRANGQCVLTYYADGKKKKEPFPVKLWMNPPAEIYIQGDVAFDPRGLVVGSNAEEFWLWLRPKEISSYWWGRWSDDRSDEKLMISPKVLLEALGIVSTETDGGVWEVGWNDGYEILTWRRPDNIAGKRIYCEGVQADVKRIEYYGPFGSLSVYAELTGYSDIAPGFRLPSKIKIVKRESDDKDVIADITVKSTSPVQFTEPQIEYIFRRKEPDSFKNVYEAVNGRWRKTN